MKVFSRDIRLHSFTPSQEYNNQLGTDEHELELLNNAVGFRVVGDELGDERRPSSRENGALHRRLRDPMGILWVGSQEASPRNPWEA